MGTTPIGSCAAGEGAPVVLTVVAPDFGAGWEGIDALVLALVAGVAAVSLEAMVDALLTPGITGCANGLANWQVLMGSRTGCMVAANRGQSWLQVLSKRGSSSDAGRGDARDEAGGAEGVSTLFVLAEVVVLLDGMNAEERRSLAVISRYAALRLMRLTRDLPDW